MTFLDGVNLWAGSLLGCPPFLGPPQMGDYAENLHANRLTDFCTLIDPFLVTGRAELFRRRVPQRAMRPDGVVFPPVPCRLFPSVRHGLEFHPLPELVTQSTVKRFYISILPGDSRGYRDRLRPHTRQPVHQRLANELRSIVTPDAGRRPATTNHPGHDPPNSGPRYRAVRMQHQALSSIFVHHPALGTGDPRRPSQGRTAVATGNRSSRLCRPFDRCQRLSVPWPDRGLPRAATAPLPQRSFAFSWVPP